MATEVGVGYVSIVPEMAGFSKKLQDQLGPGLSTAGKQAGAKLGDDLTDGVDKSVKANKRRLADTGGMLQGLLMGGAIASAAMFGKTLVDAASRQEQALGAMDAIFKDNAQAMRENAKGADKLGLSTSDYAEAASALGGQLMNLGMAQEDLAPTSDALVSTAADMAAQFGGTTMEAVQALTSAFRGEMDPIERYSVSLNESTLKAEMAKTGQDKMRASLSLIQSQLGKTGTIGAWNREVGTTASKTQVAAASWENAKAKLGDLLAPVVANVAEKLAVLAQKFTEMDPTVRAAIIAVAVLTAALIGLLWVINLINLSMLANPITWIILAIIAVVVVLVLLFWRLWNSSEAFRAKVKELWEDLQRLWEQSAPIRSKLVEAFDKIGEALGKAFDSFMENVWPELRDKMPHIIGIMAGQFIVLAAAAKIFLDVLTVIMDKWGEVSRAAENMSGMQKAAISAAVLMLPGPWTPLILSALWLAEGGTIPGVGNRDSVPGMLTPGEFVLNRTMVAQAGGTSVLEAWRQGLSGPGVNIGEVVINNPAPEPAGMSLNRSIRKVAYVGGAR